MTIEQILKKHNIYTLKEASEILNTKPDNLLKKVQRGSIQGYKVGNTWLVRQFFLKKSKGWIQFKNSDICLDIHCVCGELSHVDGEFVYYVRCPKCKRLYECKGDIVLEEITGEQIKQIEDTRTIFMETQDKM